MSKSTMTRKAAYKHYSRIKRSAFNKTREQFMPILGESFFADSNAKCNFMN